MEMIWRNSPYWSQRTYSVSRGKGDRRCRDIPFNDSGDSIASVILPRRALRLTRSINPPLILDWQAHRVESACDFFLCLYSVLLLTSGIALVGTSLWALIGRISYLCMTDQAAYLGVSSFTISAGMLCFPSSWLAWAAHSRKPGSFMPLLSLFLCVSIIMLGTGTCLGTTFQSRIAFEWISNNNSSYRSYFLKNLTVYEDIKQNHLFPRLQAGPYRSALNNSMTAAQHYYDVKPTIQFAWDTTQTRFHCCGVNSPDDWLAVREKIPATCCKQVLMFNVNNSQLGFQCSDENIYQDGCLDAVAYDLSKQISLLSGIGFIVLFIELITLMIASHIYLRFRGHLQRPHVLYHPSGGQTSIPRYMPPSSGNLSTSASAPPPTYYRFISTSTTQQQPTYPVMGTEMNQINNYQPIHVAN